MIGPVIRQLQAEGLNVFGPIPADTAFTPQFLEASDVLVAMYHDQGLPVIKHAGFGNTVNVTLRTADSAHQRRSRHGAFPRAHRQSGRGQPAGRIGVGNRVGEHQYRLWRFVNASDSIFCTTRV